ncbi:MAG: EamA family transporter [Acidobacteriota bacterium]
MKTWLLFVLGAVLFWGAYVPMMHEGQALLNRGALRAFLVVGMAYFVTAVLVPLVLLKGVNMEPWEWTSGGIKFAFIGGVLGAAGALCVILALKNGGSPLYVAPLVFAGAPIVNAFVSMAMHKPKSWPEPWFWVGLALAALGASMVLRFKPA